MRETSVYKQVPRPTDKVVVCTKILHRLTIEEDKVDKHKFGLVPDKRLGMGGLHYTKTYLPTTAAASIRMVYSDGSSQGRRAAPFFVKHSFMKADSNEKSVEISGEYQPFLGEVKQLSKKTCVVFLGVLLLSVHQWAFCLLEGLLHMLAYCAMR